MIKEYLNKNLVLGIIFLFLGACVLPTINAININNNEKNNLISTAIEASLTINDDSWWRMFRCDSGNTGSSSSTSPVRNQLSWKKNINNTISSTAPIVADNKVFISTGFFYNNFKRTNFDISSIFEGPTIYEVIEKLKSYNEDYYSGIYCLNADTGELIWNFLMQGGVSDPAVVDGKVYFTDMGSSYNGTLYCLNAETGALIWQKSLGYAQWVTSPTIVTNNKIFVCTIDLYNITGFVKCFDINGNSVWSYTLPNDELVFFSAPAVNNGKIVFRTFNLNYSGYYYGNSHLFCLNVDTGKFMWSEPTFSFGAYFGMTSPVLVNDKVYFFDFDIYTYYYNMSLKCFNAETGNILWTQNIGFSFGTPAISEGYLYTSGIDFYDSYNASMFKLNADTGSIIWTKPIDMEIFVPLFMSPTCSKDYIFLGGGTFWVEPQNQLLCLNKQNGNQEWNYTLDDDSICTPVIADERVYTADISGNVYAFEDKLEIVNILGTLLGVKAVIKNIGESNNTNVEYIIKVNGGIFGKINKTFKGNLTFIEAGKQGIAKGSPLFGFGDVNIEVKVKMPGLDDYIIKKAKGYVLGLFVFMKS